MRFSTFSFRVFQLLIVVSAFGSARLYAQEQDINKLINEWHLAATNADATAFFGSMTDDCIYIGTDKTERWTKPEFLAFAKKYFDQKKTWDFKPYDRDVHVTSDGDVAWFSELLTTWMGVCRGSGIVVKTSTGWKLAQYHLSVTVPNEIIGDFLKLIENSSSSPKK